MQIILPNVMIHSTRGNRSQIKPFLLNTGAILIAFTSIFTPRSFASSFEAICGTIRCTIVLSKEKIITPYGTIPTSRVSSWGGGGNSETDLIMGASGLYLLGPIGLIGFAAKTHDYNYALNGYDSKGNKTVVRIQFKNRKPAQKFALEMLEITRLGMNNSRTASEIKRIESLMSQQGLKWVGDLPPGTLDEGNRQEQSGKTKNMENERCWSEYLESNPRLKTWAKVNPNLAQKAQRAHRDCNSD